jgi:hypothetical protein
MKAGTKVQYYLISDSRFTTDILSEINNLFNNLLESIEGSMKVQNLHAITPRYLNFHDNENTEQYRIECYLITEKSMSKDEIYTITNKVQAHPLKFN